MILPSAPLSPLSPGSDSVPAKASPFVSYSIDLGATFLLL